MLMHCKSGADRAGLMSVLYRFLHEGVPLKEAKKELSLKYGHIRQAHTGILDYFFETLPRGQRRAADAVLRVGRDRLRPRRAQAHVPVEGLGQPHRRQRAAARVAAAQVACATPVSGQRLRAHEARVVPPSAEQLAVGAGLDDRALRP